MPTPGCINNLSKSQPLAARMRPSCIDDFFGQSHLLAPGRPLHRLIESKTLHSMILWGPPGSGKTTLAKLLAKNIDAELENISAVLAGVKDIRTIVERAKQTRTLSHRDTVLFIDEVHHFNKTQQDAFLPYVEDGTLIIIGATTENPSFELNGALLSRTRVYVLRRLQDSEIVHILDKALHDKQRGLAATSGTYTTVIADELKLKIAQAADGDARQALNFLEICADFAETHTEEKIAEIDKERITEKTRIPTQHITSKIVQEVLTDGIRRFDKRGEIFYDQISALHKSVRGSSPDAALYWLARIIDGGCNIAYLARRILRIASEDIGNADPRALTIALDAWQTYDRLGSPEGELALAQAIIYLAVAPKSNATYTAFSAAMNDAKKYGSLEVPLHLRNAPTKLMKDLNYGKHYRYAHDEQNAYATNENYFPNDIPQTKKQRYYYPATRGLEQKIAEKLEYLRKLDEEKK